MTTNALSLNQILATASRIGKPDDKFIEVVAGILSIKGKDTRPKVITYMYALVQKVKDDIETLPFDETSLNLSRSQIGAFNALDSFTAYHLTIQQAKQNFLKDANLTGLTQLHMTLSGYQDVLDLDKSTKELASTFRELAEEILSSQIPEKMAKALIRSTLQIASVLEHYYFYGEEALQSELVLLTGAMVLSKQELEKDESLYSKLTKAVGGTFKGAEKVNKGVGSVISLWGKLAPLLDYLPK